MSWVSEDTAAVLVLGAAHVDELVASVVACVGIFECPDGVTVVASIPCESKS